LWLKREAFIKTLFDFFEHNPEQGVFGSFSIGWPLLGAQGLYTH